MGHHPHTVDGSDSTIIRCRRSAVKRGNAETAALYRATIAIRFGRRAVCLRKIIRLGPDREQGDLANAVVINDQCQREEIVANELAVEGR